MATSPSRLKFGKALDLYLKADSTLASLVDVVPVSPQTKADLTGGKGRITIGFGANDTDGEYVSKTTTTPLVSFYVYTALNFNAYTILEKLVDLLQSWNATSLVMTGQKVLTSNVMLTLGPVYDSLVQAYVGRVDVEFTLTLVD